MEKKPKLYKGNIAIDDRGIVGFNNDLDLTPIKRFYTITNHVPGFIRAWHGHEKEEKYFIVTSGSAIIIAHKFEKNAMNQYHIMPFTGVKEVLSAEIPSVFYIPGGYANGFKLLTADTKLLVLSTATMEESRNDDIRIKYEYPRPHAIAQYFETFEVEER